MLFVGNYADIFLTLFYMYFSDCFTYFIPKLDSIKTFSINLAIISVKKYTEYSLIAQKIYVSSPTIQKTVTIIYNICLLCHKTIYNYKIEPNTTIVGKKINVWVNTILYLDDYNNFEESYDFLSIENEYVQPCLHMYNDIRHRIFKGNPRRRIEKTLHSAKLNYTFYSIVDKNKHIDYKNYLMLMKFYDTYLAHINLHPDKTNMISFIPSSVSFLTIQYTHPRQPYPVSIVLPKGMYTVGNELFSPIFVLRCLKYQTQSYYFDMNYSLKIIDNNIEMVKLTSKQYVKIEEKSYKIIHF